MSFIVAVCFTGIVLLSGLSLYSAWMLRRYKPPLPGAGANPGAGAFPGAGGFAATSVIVPCKGDDGSLLDNLRALLRQDHPDIEFIFSVATADDPAVGAIDTLIVEHPSCRIKKVVAGLRYTCSQQNNNQIKGIAAADARSQVLVIMDSDGQADGHFIANLTAPLADEKVGAVSGFRWYQPRWWSLADILRTVWNAGGFSFIINPRAGFVWGGAMALRRSVYEQADIAGVWSRTLSDDMTLSRRIRQMGLEIRFVPQCIVISRQPDSLGSLISWTNRQTLVTRFYNRPFWWIAALFHGLGNVLGWGLVLGALWGVIWWGYGVAGGVIWIVHLWVFAAMLRKPMARLVSPHGVDMGRKDWLLVLLAPLASLLLGLNSFCSLLTRRIHWAGVTYEIKSAQRMHVV